MKTKLILRLGLVVLAVVVLAGLGWWWPKFVVENQGVEYRFRASSLPGAVYLWKTGYWPEVKAVKVIYTSDQQQGYMLKSGTTNQEIMSMSAEISDSMLTVNIAVFNRYFIFAELCSIICA